MKVLFVSNYINHHQIPFCNAMEKETGGSFVFIQTEPMEEERVQMGWQESQWPDYVHYYYEEPDWCKQQINTCEILLFGGCDEESYIQERLQSGKLIVRYSERLYKTGQWKAISPRGLLQKYKDHTRYRNAEVYLLCAGAYVASDFAIVRAYPRKRFCWGYFPETKHYDIEELLTKKGYPTTKAGEGKVPYLLWAGRFIDWKHPERAIEAAKYLKEKGYSFRLDMIGGGELHGRMGELVRSYGLEEYVSLIGYRTPGEVRRLMEQADIFLMTSDRQEGWGAVANEAMNSGCALVAGHLPGAVPYLIRQGENGYAYEDGNQQMLNGLVELLIGKPEHRKSLGRNAYQTITETWNAENAAHSLLQLTEELEALDGSLNDAAVYSEQSVVGGMADGGREFSVRPFPSPCAPARVIGEGYPKEWAAVVEQALSSIP